MHYVETYYIPGVGQYAISEHYNPTRYTPWKDGSAIHANFPELKDCRQYIFEHIQRTLTLQETHFTKKLKEISDTNLVLANDLTNLKQFEI